MIQMTIRMEFFKRGDEDLLPNGTLLISTVSVGNVGQLACELLLANYEHQLAGCLSDPNVLPCFGHAPFQEDTHAVSLELYCMKGMSSPLYVLQQRAPAQIGRQKAFARNVALWIQESQFTKIVILSSVEAEAQRDAQIRERRCWYLQCQRNRVSELDQMNVQSLTSQAHIDVEAWLSRSLPPWSLLTECRKSGIDAVAVLSFTSEGDNLPDAVEQTNVVRHFLGLQEVATLKLSSSIRSLYGERMQMI